MVTLDLNGRRISVDEAAVVAARDEAALRAASSTPLRDLSLVLDAAIGGRPVALHRNEIRLLRKLAADAGIDELIEAMREE
jgi:hypothetical protein